MENPTLIAVENLDKVLAIIGQDVIKVIEEQTLSEFSVQKLLYDLQTQQAQLWIHVDDMQVTAWAVTQIAEYPSVKRLRFILMGGKELDRWLDELDKVIEWSQQYGCQEIEAWVRPGLRKKLETKGFRKTYEVVTRVINLKALH